MTDALTQIAAELSTDSVTIDQWLCLRDEFNDEFQGRARRLVYLWFVNDLGTHRQLAKHLGISHSTVTYHRGKLIEAGELEGVVDTAKQTRKSGRNSTKPVENSTPIQPTTTTTNDLPHHPASTPQQQCVQADDWGAATVVTAEVVTMPDGEQDYQRARQLFDEIIALSKRNFASGWTELQWNELGGYCRTFEGCCNARGRRNGSVAKKPVPSAPAFKPCLN